MSSDPTDPAAIAAAQETDPRRKAALQRIHAQRAFKQFAAVWAIVGIFMILVWAISGRGYFWPIWVIGGMGIGLVLMGINAYLPGQGPPSEDQINRQMDKL